MGQLDIFSLEGRVALIPGGGGGIGSAARRGVRGRGGAGRRSRDGRAKPADAAVERVRAAGSEGLAVIGDATDDADAERMVAETVDRFGRIDIVVNAVGGGAGQGPPPGRGVSPRRRGTGSWSSTSAARSSRPRPPCARCSAAGHGGAVLNISSVRANLGINAGYSAYVAAKGAISSLTRQWATEWAKHGIRVNAIMPTFVDTPQVASLARRPGVQGRDRQPHPARSRRRDARHRRAGHLPLLRCRVVRHRAGPRRSTAA